MFKFIWCHALVNNFRYIKKEVQLVRAQFFFFTARRFFYSTRAEILDPARKVGYAQVVNTTHTPYLLHFILSK